MFVRVVVCVLALRRLAVFILCLAKFVCVFLLCVRCVVLVVIYVCYVCVVLFVCVF